MRELFRIGILRNGITVEVYGEEYDTQEEAIKEILRFIDLQFNNNEYTVIKTYKKDGN